MSDEVNMIKISDIAKATGYSVTTVSKAFNGYTDISDKAKQIIINKANELEYIPNAQARGLVMKRSFTIGVILDELLNQGLTHPYFSAVIQSFRVAVEEEGYSMILISNKIGHSKISSYLNHCNERNVDGVFVLCTSKEDPGINALVHSKIPTVFLDNPDGETHSVTSNHYQGAYDAVSYLISLMHKKIGHIYGSELTYAGSERKRAYYDALGAHNIDIDERYLVNGGFFDFKYGKKAMEELLELEDRPTAVFASGDIIALGAMQACYEKGIRVPDDMSIIGFDNVTFLDWITPSLTTVAQDYHHLGRESCRLLMSAIEDNHMPITNRVVDTFLVERNSCKIL